MLSAPYNFATDQRGLPRALPLGETVNIGAVEFEAAQSGNAVVVNVTDDTAFGVCGVDVCTFRDALAGASAGNGTVTFSIPTTDPGYDPVAGRYTIKSISGYNVGRQVPNSVTIQGPGANKLTFDLRTNGRRVFR